jgi:undecaprenyl diphosphate synthase
VQIEELNDVNHDAQPAHVAIIMDGNGRWADQRDIPRLDGHREGADRVREITRAARRLGIKRLTLYAFSQQNWGRPSDEVRGLMQLLQDYLCTERSEILDNDIRLTAIGDLERLPDFVRTPLFGLMEESQSNQHMVLCLALSYGGREEIVRACQRIAQQAIDGDLAVNSIDITTINDALMSPDPDLLIRTSGECRLSNFLLWQSAYTEFIFTDTMWPDFTEDEFLKTLSAFQTRERRFGLRPGLDLS